MTQEIDSARVTMLSDRVSDLDIISIHYDSASVGLDDIEAVINRVENTKKSLTDDVLARAKSAKHNEGIQFE